MRLLVFGAGGHAKVVIDAAEQAGWEIAGVVDANPQRTEVLGHTVSRSLDEVSADRFIIAIGDNRARAQRYRELLAAGLQPVALVHPSAVVAPSAQIDEGSFVAAGVVVNPDARVGANAILNTGCVVEHDVIVGDHVHVGPNASLCGAVPIAEGALIGVGASVKPGATVGAWCTVGAGSAVVNDLPADTVCAGVPARVLRSGKDL